MVRSTVLAMVLGCSQVESVGDVPEDFRVEVSPDAEMLYSVPSEAILVYDIEGVFPFYVWTEPLTEMGGLDPDLMIFYDVEPGFEEDTVAGAGSGDDEAHDAGIVDDPAPAGTMVMFAYVGEEPIESVSLDYLGSLTQPPDAPPLPPGYSGYSYGSVTQRRSVVWNYSTRTGTAYFQHRHSSGSSYHSLTTKSVYANRCTYAYDCVYKASGSLRTRIYLPVDTDAFNITFKTSCSASCY